MGLSFGGESSSRELNAARLSRVSRDDPRPSRSYFAYNSLYPDRRGTDDGRPNTMDACGCASRPRPSPPALGPPRAPVSPCPWRARPGSAVSRGASRTFGLDGSGSGRRIARPTKDATMLDGRRRAHACRHACVRNFIVAFSTDRPTTRAPTTVPPRVRHCTRFPATGNRGTTRSP